MGTDWGCYRGTVYPCRDSTWWISKSWRTWLYKFELLLILAFFSPVRWNVTFILLPVLYNCMYLKHPKHLGYDATLPSYWQRQYTSISRCGAWTRSQKTLDSIRIVSSKNWRKLTFSCICHTPASLPCESSFHSLLTDDYSQNSISSRWGSVWFVW